MPHVHVAVEKNSKNAADHNWRNTPLFFTSPYLINFKTKIPHLPTVTSRCDNMPLVPKAFNF